MLLVNRTGIKAQMRSDYSLWSYLPLNDIKLEYFWGQLANLDHVLCVAPPGRKAVFVLRQIGSKLWCLWQQKDLTDLQWGKFLVFFFFFFFFFFFVCLFLIWSLLYLQISKTYIKSQTSSNFGRIGPLTTELAALERLQITSCHKNDMTTRYITKWYYITKTRLFKYIENFTTKKKKNKGKFLDRKFWHFSYSCSKQRLWLLVRTASARRF